MNTSLHNNNAAPTLLVEVTSEKREESRSPFSPAAEAARSLSGLPPALTKSYYNVTRFVTDFCNRAL
jgi:hypothetical protein